MEWEFKLLGYPEFGRTQHPPLSFPTKKAEALWAYVVVASRRQANPRVSKEELIDLLWPGMPQPSALQNLRQTLYQVRKTFVDALEGKEDADVLLLSDRNSLRLNPVADLRTDLDLIFSAPAEAKELSIRQMEAIARTRSGYFLENFPLQGCPGFDDWIDSTRNEIERVHGYCFLELTKHFLGKKQAKRALDYAEALVEMDPYSEAYHVLYLSTLAQSGNRNKAIQAYRTYAKRLGEELEIEPGGEITQLYQRLKTSNRLPGSPGVSKKADSHSLPKWIYGVLGLLIAISGIWGMGGFSSSNPTLERSNLRIAVLPFENRSSEDYLADGITDDLIISLSKVRGIQMISRQSSSEFRDSELSPVKIGEVLEVDYLIKGSIYEEAETFKTSVELLVAHSGDIRWAEQYRISEQELFTLQQIISQEVVGRLRDTLKLGSPIKARGTSPINSEAYKAYLKGRQAFYQANPEGLYQAASLFQTALDIDPEFKLAQAWLAWAFCTLAGSWGDKQAEEVFPMVEEQLEKIAPYPELDAMRYKIWGWIHLWRLDKNQAETFLRKAVAIDPSEEFGMAGLAMVLALQRKFSEGQKVARQSLDLNPHFYWNYFVLAHAHFYAGEWTLALQEIEKGLDLFPNHEASISIKAKSMAKLGDLDQAVSYLDREVERLDNRSGILLADLGTLLATQADSLKAESYAIELQERHKQGEKYMAYFSAKVFCTLGQNELALDLLEAAYESRDNELNWLEVDWEFEKIRGETRFIRLLEKLKGG